MKLSDLGPELQEKAKECTSIEELQDLCTQHDIELSDDDLKGIAGGIIGCSMKSTTECFGGCNYCPSIGEDKCLKKLI